MTPWSGGNFVDRFVEAIDASTPFFELRELLAEQIRIGANRQLLIDALQSVANAYYRQNKEAEYDLVLDLLDNLTGWCSPGTEI